jgi:phytoene/squalene synthetase
MPTVRRRHMITESERIARALDDAAQRWPTDCGNRVKLLLRLVEEGHRAVLDQRAQDVVAQREVVCRTSGALTGVFGDGYLTALRQGWPV